MQAPAVRTLTLVAAAALGLALGASGVATAQEYPQKPIKLVVPFPAGGAVDIVGRVVAEQLHKSLGQPVLVENRAGAGGGVGTELVAKAPADGYTLVVGGNGALAINKALYGKLSYDPEKDFAPISLLVSGAQVLLVHPSLQVSNLAEFVALVRKNPNRYSYGSTGIGAVSHLTMEMFKARAGLTLAHAPYRGNPQLIVDLSAGDIQAAFVFVPAALSAVKTGKVKAIAVTGAARNPLAPELPTVAEAGFPGFEASAWMGLLAPAGTPAAIVQKLAAESRRIMRVPDVVNTFAVQGFDVVGGSPEEFRDFLRDEIVKWSAEVQRSGAKPE